MANLTTLDNLKRGLRITNNGDDSLLTQLLEAVSSEFEKYTNRVFSITTHIDKFDGMGVDYTLLKHYPIQSILSAKSNGINQNILDFDNDQVVISGLFSKGRLNCSVEYVAGYDVIPKDLEQACIEMVGVKYKQIETINQSSKSLPNGAGSVNYIVKDIPDFVKVILNQYKQEF